MILLLAERGTYIVTPLSQTGKLWFREVSGLFRVLDRTGVQARLDFRDLFFPRTKGDGDAIVTFRSNPKPKGQKVKVDIKKSRESLCVGH